MQLRAFGPARHPVAIVGQGSWQIEIARRPEALAALRAGLDLGMTHIDTAEMYGAGASEQLIAEAIRGRREQVFLVSKVLPSNASARGTLKACERSLRHLGTDYLDCYLLHWRGKVPLAETVGAFEALKRDGKIRSWGVSNFDVADLDEVAAIAGPPACNQVLYNLGERAIEHAVIPWCQAHDTAVVAYTPLGSSTAIYDASSTQGRVLHDIAAAHGVTARQVALNFLLQHPSLFVIPKAARLEHVRDNAGAASFLLTPADLGAIEAAFGLGPRPRHLPMN
jgi:diketogulonate reductase-like aldo/keto reductase